jgi:hypothetical protein
MLAPVVIDLAWLPRSANCTYRGLDMLKGRLAQGERGVIVRLRP